MKKTTKKTTYVKLDLPVKEVMENTSLPKKEAVSIVNIDNIPGPEIFY